jgi:hypothetical protein
MASDERMKTLLLRMRNLPTSIVFLAVPKLPFEGFRWATATILHQGTGSMARNDDSAFCTPECLIAEYHAIIFNEVCIQHNERILFATHDNPMQSRPYLLHKELSSARMYRCNAILFLYPIEPGDSVEAVAVLCQESMDPNLPPS